MSYLSSAQWAALVATFLACSITIIHGFTILTGPGERGAQKQIIRIIFLVPIQALASLIAIYGYDWRTVLDVVRDAYQGYAIYCFLHLLIHYVGGEARGLALVQSRGAVELIPPFNWIYGKMIPTKKSFYYLKAAVLQFTLIMPLMCVYTVFKQFTGSESPDEWGTESIILLTIITISMTVSIYGLLQFYIILRDPLHDFDPLSKFISIKFVVFFSFYQDLIIQSMAHWGLIKSINNLHPSIVAHRLQECLCCVEMVLAAFIHFYCFPPSAPTSLDMLHRSMLNTRSSADDMLFDDTLPLKGDEEDILERNISNDSAQKVNSTYGAGDGRDLSTFASSRDANNMYIDNNNTNNNNSPNRIPPIVLGSSTFSKMEANGIPIIVGDNNNSPRKDVTENRQINDIPDLLDDVQNETKQLDESNLIKRSTSTSPSRINNLNSTRQSFAVDDLPTARGYTTGPMSIPYKDSEKGIMAALLEIANPNDLVSDTRQTILHMSRKEKQDSERTNVEE